MNHLKITLLFVLGMIVVVSTQNQPRDTRADDRRRQRFSHGGVVDHEASGFETRVVAREAPTGFDNQTNGFDPQGPAFDTLNEDNVVPLALVQRQPVHLRGGRDHRRRPRADLQRPVVPRVPPERRDRRRQPDGRAPHRPHARRPVLRIAGRVAGAFARDASQHRRSGRGRGRHPDVPDLDQHARRRLHRGDRQQHAARHPRSAAGRRMRGTAIIVPVLEANGVARIGRFGWKNQHASLESFSADAYLNEMGITSPLFPDENTSSGRDVDRVRPGRRSRGRRRGRRGVRELHALDQGAVARADHAGRSGRRSGLQPDRLRDLPRRHASSQRRRHADQRRRLHGSGGARQQDHPSLQRLSVCTTSAPATASRSCRRPSIADTANKMRTAPLWALRTRNRLMHDGLSFTKEEAIQRHRGQAEPMRLLFNALPAAQKAQLMSFLDSL